MAALRDLYSEKNLRGLVTNRGAKYFPRPCLAEIDYVDCRWQPGSRRSHLRLARRHNARLSQPSLDSDFFLPENRAAAAPVFLFLIHAHFAATVIGCFQYAGKFSFVSRKISSTALRSSWRIANCLSRSLPVKIS